MVAGLAPACRAPRRISSRNSRFFRSLARNSASSVVSTGLSAVAAFANWMPVSVARRPPPACDSEAPDVDARSEPALSAGRAAQAPSAERAVCGASWGGSLRRSHQAVSQIAVEQIAKRNFGVQPHA